MSQSLPLPNAHLSIERRSEQMTGILFPICDSALAGPGPPVIGIVPG